MPTSTQLKLLLFVVGAVAAATIMKNGGSFADGKTILLEIASTSTVVGFVLYACDRWLWKIWPARLLWQRASIHGTWKGTILPTPDPRNEGRSEIPCYVCIRQTLSTLSLTLHTDQSTSRTIASQYEKLADGLRRVSIVFYNEPMLEHREKSRPHWGAMTVELIGDPVSMLKGTYWTDRHSSGRVELAKLGGRTFDHFEDADGHEPNPAAAWWAPWQPAFKKKTSK